jgi:hypothetical protein
MMVREIVAYAFKIAPAPDVRAQRIKYFCDMPLQLSFSWRGLSANGLPQHLRSGAFFLGPASYRVTILKSDI